MPAKVKNPRKKFLFSVICITHPINPYLVQNVTLPEIRIEEVAHGDINRDVKTGGRISVGTLTLQKLETTSGSDTWMWDWLMSVQDLLLGGGLVPSQYWETCTINELAEDGVSVLNSWVNTCKWSGIRSYEFRQHSGRNRVLGRYYRKVINYCKGRAQKWTLPLFF